MTAFLNVPIEKGEPPVFLIPPETEVDANSVLQLWYMFKSIYGLRASPKRFSNWLAKMLQPSGWHRTQGEPQLYWSSRYPGALMSVHMDDMFLTAADDDIKKIKKDFLKDLPVKWSNPLDEKWQKFIGGGLRPESFSAVFRRNTSAKSWNTGS